MYLTKQAPPSELQRRQASADEIAVTPAMEMAGMLELDGYDPEFNDRETVVAVYRAMEMVRRTGPAGACSDARLPERPGQSSF
jgi:hypothetical protein